MLKYLHIRIGSNISEYIQTGTYWGSKILTPLRSDCLRLALGIRHFLHSSARRGLHHSLGKKNIAVMNFLLLFQSI